MTADRRENEPLLKRAAVAAAIERENGKRSTNDPTSRSSLQAYGATLSATNDSETPRSMSGVQSPPPSTHTPMSTRSTRQDDITMPPKSLLVPLCFTVWIPVFVAALDATIVATLIGSISSSFNKSEQSAWLGTSYLLSVCCFSPIYGRLCDVLGRRYALLLSMTTFAFGTLACGLAPSMEWLIAVRVMAGIGGGGLTTCTSTILSDVIPLRQRGLYQGLTNIVYGAGNALGGPLGGLLNDTIGWRNAFLIQLPFLLFATILSLFYVHVDPPNATTPPPVKTVAQGPTRNGQPSSSARSLPVPSRWQRCKTIDILGSLTLVGCVAPILLALSFMSADDVPLRSPLVWANFLGGVTSGAAFVYVERCVAQAPILPIELVLRRTPGFAGSANFFLSVLTHATIYNYPLYFQAVRGQSSSLAGLHLVPNSIALSIGSVFAGVWMRKTGRYYWLTFTNSLLMLISAIWFLTLTRNTPEWMTYAAIVPNGLGVTGVLTCTLLALINSVPRSEIAVATGMSYLFRTTGQVVGVATSGVLLQAMLKDELRKRLPGKENAKLIADIRHNSNLIKTLPFAQHEAAVEAYVVSLRAVFCLIFAAGIACSASCFMMEDLSLPDAAPSSPAATTGCTTPAQVEEARTDNNLPEQQ